MLEVPTAPAAERDTGTPRVILVDDHAMFRRGLRGLLEGEGITVLGEAGTGRAGVGLAIALAPDVAVMDLHMPVMSGIEATRRIAKVAPGTRVVVLSVCREDDDVLHAMLAGAAGYVLKDAPADDIVAAIRSAAAGELMMSPAIAVGIVARLKEDEEQRRHDSPAGAVDLTPREGAVLTLLADGLDNTEIAGRLYISPRTVHHHVSSVLHKLHVHNRVQAAVYAVREGLA